MPRRSGAGSAFPVASMYQSASHSPQSHSPYLTRFPDASRRNAESFSLTTTRTRSNKATLGLLVPLDGPGSNQCGGTTSFRWHSIGSPWEWNVRVLELREIRETTIAREPNLLVLVRPVRCRRRAAAVEDILRR